MMVRNKKIKLLSFLSAKPRIIILDEFTSALDKSSSLDIYGFLKEYAGNNGVTSINITHNLSDIEYMPGIYYYFSNKNIVRINTKEELFDLYVKGRSV
ncbi:hypothetical protein [Syntrophaceticus schinkii]|uniref:hypothetical protein n=1 Tax=Syntrophaceticus schinkii TaxID=499207 RepID=UPI0012EC9B69|nr:hypothetical protein [Syntrophaceticus schinkii]